MTASHVLTRIFLFGRTLAGAPGFWMGLIALVTLVPTQGNYPPIELCLICGERGTADAIGNVLLFLPLGLALSRRSQGRIRYRIPILLSLAVETAQHFIPGRTPGYGDMLFNSMGGWLGIWLGSQTRLWWNRSPRVARKWLVLSYTSTGSILVLTAFLVSPDPTDGVYYGQWTPRSRRLVHYDGRLTAVTIGSRLMPPGQLANTEAMRALLKEDAALHVDGVAGHRPRSLAPVASMADDAQRLLFVLGLDEDDVVYHYRSRAAAWRLDQMELRASGLASVLQFNGPLQLSFQPLQNGAAFEVNGQKRVVRAPTLGMGWRFLFGSQRFPHWLSILLNYVWLIGLAVPLAFWSRSVWSLLGACTLLVLLMATLPAFSWLSPTPPLEYLAALSGILVGTAASMRWPPFSRQAQRIALASGVSIVS